jgi:hypothetical protein
VDAVVKSRAMLAALALLAAAGMSACSTSGTPNSVAQGNSQTSSPAATASAGTGATTTPAAPAASSPAMLVPMQTANGGEFKSPSGNISCGVNYNRDGTTVAYCETGTPPQSVSMDVTGSYTTCTGNQCLSNAGLGTPTLAYGTATGVGPFVCESSTAGITCTAGGKGFRISRSGITPV